ncbi:hypothetical protein SLS55_001654 [Diplodia seriata]|uniref:SH3 domain-containing protein n=1 Tax=Diplodia seriata TaxID=420778 RepID=A0ABR3CQ36_9PEZI
MPSPAVHRKPLQRSNSYEQGDDKSTTTSPFLKETESGSRGSSTEQSLRVPFTTDKSFETGRYPVHAKKEDPVQERREAEKSLQSGCAHHRAHSPYQIDDKNQLSFERNEVLLISTKREDGWWYAKRLSSHEAGWVPSNFLERRQLVETLPEASVGSLPRRSRAIRQKNWVKRHAVYGRVELEGSEDLQLYHHFSQQLLAVRECAVCGDAKPNADFPDETRLQCKHVRPNQHAGDGL